MEVVHRDMCDLTGLGGFDAAMCLGNSFAYLDVRSAGHFARSLASCLSGGGALMLDDGFVAECLLPHWGEDERAMDAGDITVVSRNTYDPPASRVLSRYRFMRGEEREDKVATHHVLTSGQIVALLEDAGFSGIRLHDGTGPHAFRVGCPRLVVTAQLSR